MRPLLLPGLLDAARHNAAHGRPGLGLFESAHVYAARTNGSAPAPGGGPPPADERHHLAALLTPGASGTWRSAPPPADFFAAKGVLEAVLAAAGVDWRVESAERSFLHPGHSAEVAAGERPLGWIGELHPLVAREWDLDSAVAFELDADALAELAPRGATFRDLTSFPAVLQDIAVVVEEDVSAAAVEAAVRAGGGELLEGARVFDLYRGEQAGPGHKSLALRLEFRAADRTLTDDEVAERRTAIERELEAIGGRFLA